MAAMLGCGATTVCSQPWRPESSDQFNPTYDDAFIRAVLGAQEVKPYQKYSFGTQPKSPALFDPDTPPNVVVPREAEPPAEPQLRLEKRITRQPPKPAAIFNPDPGASGRREASAPDPFFKDNFEAGVTNAPAPAAQAVYLPPPEVIARELVPRDPPPPAGSQLPVVPESLALPRTYVRGNEIIPYKYENPEYEHKGEGGTNSYPSYFEPRRNRWRIPFAPIQRYTDRSTETPYTTAEPKLWHPYTQSLLKGDAPIIGQDIFLNVTLSSLTDLEARRLPVGSGVSSARSHNAEFFGRGEQFSAQEFGAVTIDLFRGEAAFKPVEWALHVQPLYNINYIYARETGVVSPNPGGNLGRTGNNPTSPAETIINPGDVDDLLNPPLGSAPDSFEGRQHTTRLRDFFALQEAFAEVHLRDLSDNYDFIASRFGNQPFVSDFRGFIFNDVNLAARIFGSADNNRYQYNLALFDLNEKDTNSELNSFDRRKQRVLIANVYRQDFIWKGYTAQLSFHGNFDDADTHYDRNGNIVRPAPLGTVVPHDVRAYYLGWTGDGHIGRLNLTHAFYQVYGRDDFNGLAGRATDIDAQMAAVELSYDRDWARYRLQFFYASGDSDSEDGTARGFDSIIDNPGFAGAPFSFYVRQGFNLAGSSVGLKQRGSLVPNLRTSKLQGQSNFVNPGVFLFGLGTDLDILPKLRTFINVNYVRFAQTDPIKTALLTQTVDEELGWDFSIGFQYRPLLTDNIILTTGFGAFLPGQGFRDIYRRTTDPVPGLTSLSKAGEVDPFFYSGILALTLTY